MLVTWLFAAAIALSSFLIFLIEPMAGKSLLPHFGGAASVWSTCLAFFTAMLFAGYAYAAQLSRLPPRRQAAVHGGMILVSLAWSLLVPLQPFGTGALGVLSTLLISLGLPFLVLSASAPLFQRWYAYRFGEPYALYALSNAAAFAGLLAFPLLLEPRLSLQGALALWHAVLALFIVLAVILAWHMRSAAGEYQDAYAASWPRMLRWAVLAALPAALLAATTSEITQIIAPVPLLWMLPLGLYLLSFVLAFAGFSGGRLLAPGLLVLVIAAFALSPARSALAPLQLTCYLAVLFAASWLAHARLYASRPSPERLTLFYLALGFGGMAGTMAVAFLAPVIFVQYLEFPLLVGAAALLAVRSLALVVPRIASIVASVLICTGIALFFWGRPLIDVRAERITSVRDFYGVKTVGYTEAGTFLLHGRTLHGLQLSGASSTEPQVYYTALSGIGRALSYARAQRGTLAYGVVGLGTGSLAAYCTPGDTVRFFEIDRQVIAIAQHDFSYLARCAGAAVLPMDGRLALREDAEGIRFDVLAIDAFDGDAVPTHLLTREAFALYGSRLRGETSIVALHVSNRYLDLSPVVVRTAADAGFASMVVRDRGRPDTFDAPTTWILLSRDARVFRDPVFAGSETIPVPAAARGWTDDFSSVQPLLRLF